MTAPARISQADMDRAAFPHWPRLLSRAMAAQYLGIGISTLDDRGPNPKRIGRRVLYDIRDLDRWADALEGQPLSHDDRQAEGGDIERRIRERLAQ